MTSQALILKIHCTLSANQKAIVGSMYNNGSYVDSTVMSGMASQALQLKRSHQKKRKKI